MNKSSSPDVQKNRLRPLVLMMPKVDEADPPSPKKPSMCCCIRRSLRSRLDPTELSAPRITSVPVWTKLVDPVSRVVNPDVECKVLAGNTVGPKSTGRLGYHSSVIWSSMSLLVEQSSRPAAFCAYWALPRVAQRADPQRFTPIDIVAVSAQDLRRSGPVQKLSGTEQPHRAHKRNALDWWLDALTQSPPKLDPKIKMPKQRPDEFRASNSECGDQTEINSKSASN
jgi:hypothetical protein